MSQSLAKMFIVNKWFMPPSVLETWLHAGITGKLVRIANIKLPFETNSVRVFRCPTLTLIFECVS